jgi:hypothetical protein
VMIIGPVDPTRQVGHEQLSPRRRLMEPGSPAP